MKKRIGMLVLIILLSVSLFGCAPKVAIDGDQFVSIMSEKGFMLVDNLDIANGQANSIWVAVSPDQGFQIEFYDLLSEDQAKSAYAQDVAAVESQAGGASVSTGASASNYSITKTQSDGKYMCVSRIDNTIIYFVADERYKDEIDEILKELGY